MNFFEPFLKDDEIPCFYKVSYQKPDDHIEDIEAAVNDAIASRDLLARIRPGQRIAVAVGSREIQHMPRIVRAVVQCIADAGATPFIIPAMGSHGGATAEGQIEVLRGYGITPEAMGAEIHSSMETAYIGDTKSGLPVHIDCNALAADGIVPIGRIKPHTDFRGPVESGMAKMMAIGLGKQYGANLCHKLGFPNMSKNVSEIAGVMIAKAPLLFSMGIIENGYHNTHRIVAVPAETTLEEEPALLNLAKELMLSIPFEKVDILIVDEIGKDISGAGMDPNVTGRSAVNGKSKPFVERIVIRDLTNKSHHNATGMGNGDVITRRFYDKIDMQATYPNSITACDCNGFRIPIVMDSDSLALRFALHTTTEADAKTGYRAMWIRNTVSMHDFYVTERLRQEAERHPHLRVESGPVCAVFDGRGDFTGFADAE